MRRIFSSYTVGAQKTSPPMLDGPAWASFSSVQVKAQAPRAAWHAANQALRLMQGTAAGVIEPVVGGRTDAAVLVLHGAVALTQVP